LIELQGPPNDARTKGEDRYCFLFNDLLLVTKEKSGYFKKHKDVRALTVSDLKDQKMEFTFKCLYSMHIAEVQLIDVADVAGARFTNVFQVLKNNVPYMPPTSGLVKSSFRLVASHSLILTDFVNLLTNIVDVCVYMYVYVGVGLVTSSDVNYLIVTCCKFTT
jgi:hypothetical protein